MVVCPECGKPLKTVDTVTVSDGVYRRRKCVNGHVSYSVETIVERQKAQDAFYIGKKLYKQTI